VAGAGVRGFAGDGADAAAARLNQPLGLAVDSHGALFIVDSLNYRVRRVGIEGIITTVFGGETETRSGIPTARYYPSGVAIDAKGQLLIADVFNHRIWKVTGVAASGLVGGLPTG
jgi:hypothetical protein